MPSQELRPGTPAAPGRHGGEAGVLVGDDVPSAARDTLAVLEASGRDRALDAASDAVLCEPAAPGALVPAVQRPPGAPARAVQRLDATEDDSPPLAGDGS